LENIPNLRIGYGYSDWRGSSPPCSDSDITDTQTNALHTCKTYMDAVGVDCEYFKKGEPGEGVCDM